jgi:UDP-N-acetylglucosamine pyrophosphorylase
LYPLGGAADRLHLLDEETGAELPAAKLQFAGRSLIESLVRDLQAREWLYYRVFGKQITTPIAIMSSWEKENCVHVKKIFEDHNWFGRSEEQFRFFVQPLVPAFNETGQWHWSAPLKPVLKPGGHGAIWKLARDEGVFAWLKRSGKKKALVRQINNPIAGLDYGLLAFCGIGFSKDMSFGFASCERIVQSAEGVVVLVEKPSGEVVLTNIEYCDFPKFGIVDEPIHSDHPYFIRRFRSRRKCGEGSSISWITHEFEVINACR